MFVVMDVHRNRTQAQFAGPQDNEVRSGNDPPRGVSGRGAGQHRERARDRPWASLVASQGKRRDGRSPVHDGRRWNVANVVVGACGERSSRQGHHRTVNHRALAD